jgi:hypothetical protein
MVCTMHQCIDKRDIGKWPTNTTNHDLMISVYRTTFDKVHWSIVPLYCALHVDYRIIVQCMCMCEFPSCTGS